MVSERETNATRIFANLENRGVRRAYGVTGGASMFLNMALKGCSSIDTVFCLHEQAAAMAACSDSMLTGEPVVVFATNGPGSLNLLTGVAAAYLDSVPIFIVTGEVRTEHLEAAGTLRNKGIQAFPIDNAARAMTKAFHRLQFDDSVDQIVDELVDLALSPRKGPVWLQVPLDVQNAPSKAVQCPATLDCDVPFPTVLTNPVFDECVSALKSSARPLLWLGEGARSAVEDGSVEAFCNSWDPVVVTSWRMKDRERGYGFESYGSPGTLANEIANCLVESADLIIGLGTRLDYTQLGFDRSGVAPTAKKIGVDVDVAELGKHSGWLDTQVLQDAESWLESVTPYGDGVPKWGSFVQTLLSKPEFSPFIVNRSDVATLDGDAACSTVRIIAEEAANLFAGEIVVVGSSGSAIELFLHHFNFCEVKRLLFSTGLGSMGSALPSVVGAHCASHLPIICFESDGSLLFNVQELATIKAMDAPVLLCILDNLGYASIRNSQASWFDDGWFGADEESGLPTPNLRSILDGFGIDTQSIATVGDLRSAFAGWRSQPRLQALHFHVEGSEDRLPRVPSRLDPDGKMVQAAFDELVGGAPEASRMRLQKALKSFSLEQ